MYSLGYNTYLLHGGRRNMTLFPVYGSFWHDDLEICAHRERFYGTTKWHCWNDLLVVRRANECLRTGLLAATNEQTSAGYLRRRDKARGMNVATAALVGGYGRAFPACPGGAIS